MRRACALPFARINRQKQRSPAGGHWAEGTVQQIEKSRHGETSILGADAKRVKLTRCGCRYIGQMLEYNHAKCYSKR
jgi:hypothetical protein